MRPLLLFLFVFAIASCSHQKTASILNTDVLPKQTFRINTTTDTVLKTAGGASIKIDNGSLSGNDVELEVKEAYSFEDIVSAGLTTQSNGRPLSSGGMIYINAVDKNIKIVKPVKVSLPTKAYDVEMKLFKGEEGEGKINWGEPQLFPDTLSPYLMRGKDLFTAMCANCHAYDRILAGPALAGLESRGPWKNRLALLQFTANPENYIAHNCYARNLAAQFNGQIMPSFPMLYGVDSFPARMKSDLNALYDYLRNEDIKYGIDLTDNYVPNPCDDSCFRYDSVRFAVEERLERLALNRKDLIDSNGNRIHYQRFNNTGTARLPDVREEQGTIPKNLVDTADDKAVYYRFDIKSFGWYNVDKLLDVAKADACTLSVIVDEQLSKEIDVFMAVPKYKTFERGGKLSDGLQYGFYSRDGKIPLPPGEKAAVFALGEADGQIIFAAAQFVSTVENKIQLLPGPVSKDVLAEEIKRLALERISVQAAGSKNAAEIKKIEEEMSRQQGIPESFRPRSCDCNCGQAKVSEKDVSPK